MWWVRGGSKPPSPPVGGFWAATPGCQMARKGGFRSATPGCQVARNPQFWGGLSHSFDTFRRHLWGNMAGAGLGYKQIFHASGHFGSRFWHM